MKLITLNLWGGRIKEPLLNFVKNHAGTDIFCFQEIYHNSPAKMSDERLSPSLNLYTELQETLPDHQPFFRPVIKNIYGIGIFIKKEIKVVEEGEVVIYHVANYSGNGGDHTRKLQWIKCDIGGTVCHILNVHGLWTGINKKDASARLEQSRIIKEFMNTITTPIILCGDFNLLPNTKSVEMVAAGMNNLIQTHGITSTRTSFYDKAEKFADYIFTSPNIVIKNFRVLPDEVSDHSPLLLEF
jgi:endonuclease/exonuclease/phosphatase family metal-dependent hydrolase